MAILGNTGRYWAILSDINQYRLYYLGIRWDRMITVPTEYHCIALFKTMYYPLSMNMFTSYYLSII